MCAVCDEECTVAVYVSSLCACVCVQLPLFVPVSLYKYLQYVCTCMCTRTHYVRIVYTLLVQYERLKGDRPATNRRSAVCDSNYLAIYTLSSSNVFCILVRIALLEIGLNS